LKFNQKSKLLLYSEAYYAEACNELAEPISAIQRQVNTATCVDVEAVAKHLQRCVRLRNLFIRLFAAMAELG